MSSNPAGRPYWSLTSLAGRGVILNGAANSVGFAIAERVLEAGASLLAVDTDGGELEKMQRALSSVGAMHSLAADATRASEIDRLLEYATAVLPNLFGLVHNVGAKCWTRLPTMTDAMWKGLLETRLTTTASCIRAFSRAASCLDGASIVVVATPDVQIDRATRPEVFDYTSAELDRFVHVTAIEVASPTLRVNAIAPGTPASRRANADDTARLAAFYLSDLSSAVCGATLPATSGAAPVTLG